MPALRPGRPPVAVTGDIRPAWTPGTGYHKDGEPRTGPVAFRPLRNGVPEVSYAYRQRTYPWAQRALAAAEAEHGKPGDRPDSASIKVRAARAQKQADKQRTWRARKKAEQMQAELDRFATGERCPRCGYKALYCAC